MSQYVARELTFSEKTEILRFLANQPFKEINFKQENGDLHTTQIIGVHYAAQEITLRDFCQYEVEEIIASEGFRDLELNAKWSLFLRIELKLPLIDKDLKQSDGYNSIETIHILL